MRVDSKSARVASVGLLTLWLASGCTPQPQPVNPQTSGAPTTAEAPATPAPEPSPAPSLKSAREDTLVLIDPGSPDEGSETTLAGAARAERERRANAARPVAVITNQTLSSAGTKGGLTSATPGSESEVVQPQPGPTSESARDESFWRNRALDLRLAWRQAVDDVERLERSADHFRRRFYAEDDPYVRDGQIKPAWDRVLDQLRRSREEVEASKGELEAFLEEGRRAGALPGWLREGVEHEPEPLPEEPTPGEPVEPRIFDEDQP